MARELYTINSDPSYRLGAVIESFCSPNSVRFIRKIEPEYSGNELSAFTICYDIVDNLDNQAGFVETHRSEVAKGVAYDRNQQGYNVFLVPINQQKTAVVSVKQKVMSQEQSYSGYQR